MTGFVVFIFAFPSSTHHKFQFHTEQQQTHASRLADWWTAAARPPNSHLRTLINIYDFLFPPRFSCAVEDSTFRRSTFRRRPLRPRAAHSARAAVNIRHIGAKLCTYPEFDFRIMFVTNSWRKFSSFHPPVVCCMRRHIPSIAHSLSSLIHPAPPSLSNLTMGPGDAQWNGKWTMTSHPSLPFALNYRVNLEICFLDYKRLKSLLLCVIMKVGRF